MKAYCLSFLFMLLVSLDPLCAKADITSIHHTIKATLDPQQRVLEVSDNLKIKGSGEAIFQLAPNLIVTNIKKNGQPIVYKRQGNTLRVELGNENQHNIKLKYRGFLTRLPPMRGRARRMPLIASEKGSYLSPWSAWHPYVEGIAASYHLSLTLPEPHKAIVPGRLIEERSKDGFYSAVFESEISTVGIVLIAGPFVVNERRHKKLVLRTYFSPELADLSDKYLKSTARHIDYFEELIGDYPFSSFSIVSGPLPVGLGFSGMTYMGERVLRLPFIRFTSLGHEVLHNWWGNGVKIDYKKGNWAEGLTTYMADYALSEKREAGNAKRMRTEWLRDYAALPPQRDHSVRSFIGRDHDASQIIGYNKAAFFFHMLLDKVGKENFKHSIRWFWDQHRFQTASWEDIQKAFEKISNLNLQTFFEQWIDRSGAPRLKMSNVNLKANKISFTLSQQGPPYLLNVPIKLTTKNGEELFRASISDKVSQIDLQLSEAPISISVDPGFDIFRRLDTSKTVPILRDTTLSANSVAILISTDKVMKKVAKQLATKMMDTPPNFIKASQISEYNGPVLIIGKAQEVEKFLHQNNFPTTPKALQGRGSARVWAARRKSNNGAPQPLIVIEASSPQALHNLLRPLPHYGRRSYLVFEASTVLEAGVWPAESSPLSVTFN